MSLVLRPLNYRENFSFRISGVWINSRFCLLFGEGWSKAHRNQSRSFCSVQWILNYIHCKVESGGEKQQTEQQMGQGGNDAIQNVRCSLQSTGAVRVCKRISVESYKENGLLHFQPRKLLWIHLIKQNISFYCFNNKSYTLNKCNICNTIKM